jgi:hypothetical protein
MSFDAKALKPFCNGPFLQSSLFDAPKACRFYCCVSGGKLKFKNIVGSTREIVQVGKGTTHGIASTALYRGSRGEVGWIYQFDRQASAMIADHLES